MDSSPTRESFSSLQPTGLMYWIPLCSVPDRFDRHVVVPRPDIKGREGILQVHTRKVPLSMNVDVRVLARSTPGFTGADLENLVNEAAFLAARNDTFQTP